MKKIAVFATAAAALVLSLSNVTSAQTVNWPVTQTKHDTFVTGYFLAKHGGLQKGPTGVQYVAAAHGGLKATEAKCWAAAYELIEKGYDAYCATVTASTVEIAGMDIRFEPKAPNEWPEL